MEIKKEKWNFNENIGFEDVSGYIQKFTHTSKDTHIIFDLSNTMNIHSSFIGFLIHVKSSIAKTNNSLTLILSYTSERILVMLNIIKFFSPEIITIIDKKSA
jgi:hypothetical protein